MIKFRCIYCGCTCQTTEGRIGKLHHCEACGAWPMVPPAGSGHGKSGSGLWIVVGICLLSMTVGGFYLKESGASDSPKVAVATINDTPAPIAKPSPVARPALIVPRVPVSGPVAAPLAQPRMPPG